MSEAAARFEKSFADHQRRIALQAIIGWLVFLACFVVALQLSNVTLERLIGGWGKLGEYIHLMLPDLTLAQLFADVHTKGSIAYWYYGFPEWAAEIWQSIEMAILSTVLGFVGAFLWSFPAARNLGVLPWLTWLCGGSLRFAVQCPSSLPLSSSFSPSASARSPACWRSRCTRQDHSASSSPKCTRISIASPIEGVTAAGASWVS